MQAVTYFYRIVADTFSNISAFKSSAYKQSSQWGKRAKLKFFNMIMFGRSSKQHL